MRRGGQDTDIHRGTTLGGHGEETTVCTPRREASGGSTLPTPGPQILASRTGESESCCLSKAPCLTGRSQLFATRP